MDTQSSEGSACKDCTSSSCSARDQRADETQEEFLERQELAERMCRIKHKILILSGKGGVGKSTVAVNLAAALQAEGKKVGILDVDIHGPTICKMLHMENTSVAQENGTIIPADIGGLKVMSVGLLIPDPEAAVIWRGPMKWSVIKQFLKDVAWGDLDYLIIDSPPGTGDEPLSVCQLIEDADGAVIVTTPQEVALADVRRSVTFCRQLKLRVLGVIENMSGFLCPHCNERVDIFNQGGGAIMAGEMGLPFLGSLPIDTEIVKSGDAGLPGIHFNPDSPAAKGFLSIADRLQEELKV